MQTYRIKKDDDKTIVEDRTVWMGIDMHKRQFTVVIVDDDAEASPRDASLRQDASEAAHRATPRL